MYFCCTLTCMCIKGISQTGGILRPLHRYRVNAVSVWCLLFHCCVWLTGCWTFGSCNIPILGLPRGRLPDILPCITSFNNPSVFISISCFLSLWLQSSILSLLFVSSIIYCFLVNACIRFLFTSCKLTGWNTSCKLTGQNTSCKLTSWFNGYIMLFTALK